MASPAGIVRNWRAAISAAPTKAVQKLATSDNKFKVRFYESAKVFRKVFALKIKHGKIKNIMGWGMG